ncbi:hypothetical protein COU94_02350 [Candidatus Shapirobacteria bacterium CG10_big_fil_rev_8_21_14_0_10_38_8]|nr:MAG: hypothetical protein COU94_02350 [Candidatus Shapirobacteria bacterium CG10_big_fil_rev_8_21_14_0_10_38_8]
MPKKSLKSKKNDYSIIIITKNQKAFLQKSLPAILSQTIKNLEIIIVDSGSTDGALEFAKKYPVKIINYHSPVFNFAKAFNLGAQKAKGQYLVRLSGDAVPANKHWLKELGKDTEKPKVAGAFSRYVFSAKNHLLHQFWFREWPLVRKVPFSVGGGSFLIKKSLWKKCPFNEKWGPGEDWEWAEVVRKAGYKILYKRMSLVYHEHQAPLLKQILDFLYWLFISIPSGFFKYNQVRIRIQKLNEYYQ